MECSLKTSLVVCLLMVCLEVLEAQPDLLQSYLNLVNHFTPATKSSSVNVGRKVEEFGSLAPSHRQSIEKRIVQRLWSETSEPPAYYGLVASFLGPLSPGTAPDLECETIKKRTRFVHYQISQFANCVWNDVRSQSNTETLSGFLINGYIPYATNLQIPVFGITLKAPMVLMVSSNGFITVGYFDPHRRASPKLEKTSPPYKVVGGYITQLIPRADSTVTIATFYRSMNAACHIFQWNDFDSVASSDAVNIQLEVCTNGTFFSRIQKPNKAVAQIGVNEGDAKNYRAEFIAVPEAEEELLPANTGFAIIPNDSAPSSTR